MVMIRPTPLECALSIIHQQHFGSRVPIPWRKTHTHEPDFFGHHHRIRRAIRMNNLHWCQWIGLASFKLNHTRRRRRWPCPRATDGGGCIVVPVPAPVLPVASLKFIKRHWNNLCCNLFGLATNVRPLNWMFACVCVCGEHTGQSNQKGNRAESM